MEIDTGNHDVGAGFGVTRGFRVEGYSCPTTTHGLNDEGDYVDGAEDPEVPDWSDGAYSGSSDGDHASEDDIDSGGEEGGCYTYRQHEVEASVVLWKHTDDQRADLHQEGIGIVGTLTRPGSGCPAYNLSCEDWLAIHCKSAMCAMRSIEREASASCLDS